MEDDFSQLNPVHPSEPFRQSEPARPSEPAQPINPYQPPVNPYQSSTYEPYRSPSMSSGNGTLALWLGVISMIASTLGVICCIPFLFNLVGLISGVVAVVLGVKEMRAVREGYAHASNRTTAQLGVVFGSIGIVISLLLLLLFAGFIAFAILADPP